MKQTLTIDITDLDVKNNWDMDYTEHVYFSCQESDTRLENAYYNGCPRCVKIACKIAEEALKNCNVVITKEE